MKEFIIPDGHRSGLPLVEIDKKFAEDWLVPEVNYEGLEEMYHRDLGVSRLVNPHLKFGYFKRPGFYNFYTKQMSVNPVDSAFGFKPYGITQVILHEGQHLADFSVNKFKAIAEVALLNALCVGSTYGSMKAAGAIGLPELSGAPAGILGYNGLLHPVTYKTSPLEKRARAIQTDPELIAKYKGVVHFGKVGGRPWLI